jgi:16S rRNA (uracil1498-N3)-methyltransferase
VQVEPRHDPPITIGFALVKGERPEWIVQKLTEIGVDRIVAVRARRCVVRWTPEQESKNLVRLRRIAREASMQARRAWLPEVAPVADLADLAAATPGGVVLADPAGVPPSLSRPTLVVGPEGGWDPEELDGVATTRLGPQILRSETAALVAGVVLCTLRAGLLEPAADPGS